MIVSIRRQRQSKRPGVKALVEQAQAGAVEEKYFQRITTLSEEHEQRARSSISTEPLGHEPG